MKGLLSIGIGLSIFALASVSGCAERPTTLGPDFGLAYTEARDHQILYPDAGKNLEVVQGLEDGTAAKNTMDRYRSSFENPESYRTTVTNPSVISQGIQTK